MTYYSDNREEVLKKANRKITCGCGVVLSYSSMSWHRRSTKHQIWERMATQQVSVKLPPMGDMILS